MLSVVPAQCPGYTAKNCWTSVLGSVVIQLYAGECMPSVDWALIQNLLLLIKKCIIL